MMNLKKLYPLASLFLLLAVAVGPASANGAGKSLAEFEPQLSQEFILLLNEADVEKGEVIFMRKCSSCHEHEQSGGHWKGPHLWNIIGRKAGSVPGFEFSDAMRGSGHRWNLAALNYYLTRTDQAVPGLAMNFRGIKSDKSRASLIAFLRTLSDNPVSLPNSSSK
ncbi:MAG: c-type cytochrome [Gammaproteobacteria bacterium]